MLKRIATVLDERNSAMFKDFTKAIRQLNDPVFRRILIRSALAAMGVFLALIVAIFGGLTFFQATDIGWLNTALSILGAFLAVYIAFLLFPAAVAFIVGFYVEDAAAAVETKDYPYLPASRPISWIESLGSTAKLAVVALALNIVVLPIYLILLFFPPLSLGLFYVLNGYLLGREYFDLVASRHLKPGHVESLRKKHSFAIQRAGTLIALLFSIPFVNLAAPLLGAAAMVHLFHRLNETRVVATGVVAVER
ncbi:MAG: EI24 domain-containing protein [Alphaproteobacteria bacterium]